MTQQTALEWLEDNLIGNPHTEKDFMHNKNVFQEAKQMEKEQIENAYTDGLEGPYIGAREYYNETYNQNK